MILAMYFWLKSDIPSLKYGDYVTRMRFIYSIGRPHKNRMEKSVLQCLSALSRAFSKVFF